jgi:hypothetical protein
MVKAPLFLEKVTPKWASVGFFSSLKYKMPVLAPE